MKFLAVASALSLAATLLIAPIAQAAGFIMVDPGLVPSAAIVRPPFLHPPGRPPIMPNPPHTLLHGGVSYGLHLQSEKVNVEVTDQVAKTYITQIFMNDTDRNLAGTYLFPLPDDTTFSSFSLHIDGKPVEGKILEANEARQQYEAIVRQMVDPGLLEYADYKTVRARIFPIPAHGTKKVELEYTQVLKADNGMLKYSFPLKLAGEAAPVDQVEINTTLASKQGLRTIWSPSHEISVNKVNDKQAKIAFLAHNSVPDKDFLLYYSVSDRDMTANLITHKNADEDGYFLLALSPPVKGQTVIGKDIVLAVDTSGSMQGEKIEQAKKALKYIVGALNPEDRFGLLQFNTDVNTFKSSIAKASSENKKSALAFIDDLEARGGTNISDALHTGMSMLNETSERPAYLVLMTDGEPTVGETSISGLLHCLSSKRDLRLFDFGVGYDVNTKLLNKLAEEHHGTAQYVEPNENLELALASFYNKIKSPVLNNVKLDFAGLPVKDVYPREVKDIFAGSQVLLIGKYKSGAKGILSMHGTINGVERNYSFPVNFSSEENGNTYLPRLWAMRRIGYLTEIAEENNQNREVIDEIVSLSQKYGIISAYTSFLVTDPSENHRLQTAVAAGVPRQAGVGGATFVTGLRGRGGGAAPAPAADLAALPPPSSLPPPPFDSFGAQSAVRGKIYKDKISLGSPASGQQAVAYAKKISNLKGADNLVEREEEKSAIKVVEDKTFYLTNGFWTDSTYNPSSWPKPKSITFGIDEYFKLVHSLPEIKKYLSLGQQLIVVYKGQCYKIVASQTS